MTEPKDDSIQDEPTPEHRQALAAELAKYGFELSDEQIDLLSKYSWLLWQWNKKLNLTRHDDIEKFVTRDVNDSWQLSDLLAEGEDVVDLGTGGGVPGIILKILRPDLDVTLCESVGKKARVVNEIVSDLNLPMQVLHGRLEHALDDLRYSAVICRAVGPLWKILFWLQDHWLTAGRLLAIKGPKWIEERKEARHRGLCSQLEMRCAKTYIVPGTEIESVILKIWPEGAPEK